MPLDKPEMLKLSRNSGNYLLINGAKTGRVLAQIYNKSVWLEEYEVQDLITWLQYFQLWTAEQYKGRVG